MKKFLIEFFFTMLGWALIMAAALFALFEIINSEPPVIVPAPVPAHEITVECNRHGFFWIHKRHGEVIWYERKWRV